MDAESEITSIVTGLCDVSHMHEEQDDLAGNIAWWLYMALGKERELETLGNLN